MPFASCSPNCGRRRRSPTTASRLWKKSSMPPSVAWRPTKMVHEVDRRKRRGFPGSTAAASSGGRLYPRAARRLWEKSSLAPPAAWRPPKMVHGGDRGTARLSTRRLGGAGGWTTCSTDGETSSDGRSTAAPASLANGEPAACSAPARKGDVFGFFRAAFRIEGPRHADYLSPSRRGREPGAGRARATWPRAAVPIRACQPPVVPSEFAA